MKKVKKKLNKIKLKLIVLKNEVKDGTRGHLVTAKLKF